jgi:tetratricopeptide (TPR) repeat protein
LIAGSGGIHPVVHMATYHAQNGHAQQAVKLYRAAMPRFSALDPDPAWQGLVQYDLACVYSLAGQKGKGMEALKKALRLVPELNDWAHQDTDLINLREETEFRELFKD